jgi:hypothetical protein
MKKMKLELDALAVESFETAAVGKRTGTVHGAAQTQWYTCPGYGETCNGGDTCWDSCAGTCRCVTFADSCGDVSCIDTCAMTCGNCAPSVNEAHTCHGLPTCAAIPVCG